MNKILDFKSLSDEEILEEFSKFQPKILQMVTLDLEEQFIFDQLFEEIKRRDLYGKIVNRRDN